MSDSNNNTLSRLFWRFVLIISIIIMIICIIVIVLRFTPNNNYSKLGYKEVTSNQAESELITSPENGETIEVLPDNPIDFNKLSNINPDIYAWINIPNTNIDYAIVQAGPGRDDFFYLNHNIEGNYEFDGSIYTEKQNALDFSDPVTLIYGHNLLNGTMFSELHKFADSEFFKNNKELYIYTKGHILTYKIYAAYVYDNRHILNSFDFSKEEDISVYFDSTLNPISMIKNVRDKVKLDLTDKVITLSTCTKDGNKSTRYLVQGVLIKDERTK